MSRGKHRHEKIAITVDLYSSHGWQPCTYGVECEPAGKPFVNSTYDLR